MAGKKIEKVKFISKYKNHKLIKKPTRIMMQDGLAYSVPGESIQFENFEYTTTDKADIDFIRKHKLFNAVIFEGSTEIEEAGE